jgi:hypothetical protein
LVLASKVVLIYACLVRFLIKLVENPEQKSCPKGSKLNLMFDHLWRLSLTQIWAYGPNISCKTWAKMDFFLPIQDMDKGLGSHSIITRGDNFLHRDHMDKIFLAKLW